jgi:hypothetical protein
MFGGSRRCLSFAACCALLFCALPARGQGPDPQGVSLLGLVAAEGRLVPEFRADVTRYAVDLPMGTSTAELKFSIAEGSTLRVNERALDATVPWRSRKLVRDETVVVVEVSRPGASPRVYELNVRRGRLPVELQAQSAGLSEFGARVALSHKTLAIAGVASGRGRQIELWTLAGDDWVHGQTLFVRECGTQTGHVSLSIDDDVMVIGCSSDPADDPGHVGGAFVFLRVAGTWVGPTPLRAADGKNGEFFGESVAVSDDTVVVGAPLANVRDDRGETRTAAGAVYVFKRVGRSWQQQARLTARNASEDDGLGAAVAVYGDTLAASAPFEDSVKTGVNQNGRDDDAPDSGAVYVFVRRAGRWTQQAYIKAPRPDPAVAPQWGGNQFGGGDSSAGPSLALWGDTLAIGAPGEDWLRDARASEPQLRYVIDAGAVYIFKRRDNNWGQDARIVPIGRDAGGNFGMSIALQGNRMVVGAWQHLGVGSGLNDPQPAAPIAPPPGAAFVFQRGPTGFVEAARMGAAAPAPSQRFGWSVAVSEHAIVIAAPSSAPAAVSIFR